MCIITRTSSANSMPNVGLASIPVYAQARSIRLERNDMIISNENVILITFYELRKLCLHFKSIFEAIATLKTNYNSSISSVASRRQTYSMCCALQSQIHNFHLQSSRCILSSLLRHQSTAPLRNYGVETCLLRNANGLSQHKRHSANQTSSVANSISSSHRHAESHPHTVSLSRMCLSEQSPQC